MSEWIFRRIFNTEFNLIFARLKVDTCGTCDKINAEIKSNSQRVEQLQKLEGEKQVHLHLVERLSEELKKALDMARDPNNKTRNIRF